MALECADVPQEEVTTPAFRKRFPAPNWAAPAKINIRAGRDILHRRGCSWQPCVSDGHVQSLWWLRSEYLSRH